MTYPTGDGKRRKAAAAAILVLVAAMALLSSCIQSPLPVDEASLELARTGTAQSIQMAYQITQAVATDQRIMRQTESAMSLSATQTAITGQIVADAEARRWATVRQVMGIIMLVVLFFGAIFAGYKLWPLITLRAGVVKTMDKKSTVLIPDGNGGFTWVDMTRSVGPGIVVKNGNVLSTGYEDLNVQNQVAARAQAGELVMFADGNPKRGGAVRQAAGMGTTINQIAPGESQNDLLSQGPRITVLDAGSSPAREWLGDVRPQLLEDGED